MKKVRPVLNHLVLVLTIVTLSAVSPASLGQDKSRQTDQRGAAKPVTVPVTIRKSKPEREIQYVDFLVREDGEMQDILSIRRPNEVPLTVAFLIQDDLVSSVATDTKRFRDFIRSLPLGSHVMVGYIRSGSLDVRRKFTNDLDKAAASVRPPLGLASASPFNPFVEIIEALRRFDSQPAGRRGIVLVSDGLDLGRGIESASPSDSIDLARAITEAQRRAVPVYSMYAPGVALQQSNNQLLIGYAQSSLEKLSSDTGGRAYFQGAGAPVSFEPFLKDINGALSMQIALTYLSTHTAKGFHRLDIKPVDGGVELRHPAGYTR